MSPTKPMTSGNRFSELIPLVTAAGLAAVALSVAAWSLSPPAVAGDSPSGVPGCGVVTAEPARASSAVSPLVVLTAGSPGDAVNTVDRARAEKRLKARGWAGLELERSEGRLRIVRVIAGSPAESAGLRAGDRVVSIAGMTIGSGDPGDFEQLGDRMAPGQRVRYAVEREGETKRVRVTLARIPAQVLARWLDGATSRGSGSPSIARL